MVPVNVDYPMAAIVGLISRVNLKRPYDRNGVNLFSFSLVLLLTSSEIVYQ